MNLSGKSASKYVQFSDEYNEQEQIGVGSIDVRIDKPIILFGGVIMSMSSALVSTIEKVNLDESVSALLVLRTSTFRRGLSLASTGYIDPGFSGNLTFRVTNVGEDMVRINKGERIAQLIFFEMRDNDSLYDGKYQNSDGVVGFIPDSGDVEDE